MITMIDEAREEIGRLNGEIGRLHGELAASMRSVIDERDEARRERDVAREEVGRLRRERNEAREELASEKARFVSILTTQNESCGGDQSKLVAELRRVVDDEHALTSTHAAAMTAAVVIQHLEATVAEYAARIDDLQADRDEERRRMAWELVLMVARSGVNPESEWPTAKAWAVVDAFLAAEREGEA